MNQPLRTRRDLSYLSIGYFAFAALLCLVVFSMAGVVWLVSRVGSSETDLALLLPFGIVILVMSVLMVLQIACGVFIRSRRFRNFCVGVSICNCLLFPLGTILGIFTLMLLNRADVLEEFGALSDSEARHSPTTPPSA